MAQPLLAFESRQWLFQLSVHTLSTLPLVPGHWNLAPLGTTGEGEWSPELAVNCSFLFLHPCRFKGLQLLSSALETFRNWGRGVLMGISFITTKGDAMGTWQASGAM